MFHFIISYYHYFSGSYACLSFASASELFPSTPIQVLIITFH